MVHSFSNLRMEASGSFGILSLQGYDTVYFDRWLSTFQETMVTTDEDMTKYVYISESQSSTKYKYLFLLCFTTVVQN